MTRIAINGFGRIGRLVFRAGIKDPNLEFVAINDLVTPDNLAYLLKYDSTHGRFQGTVEHTDKELIVDGKKVLCVSERDPEKLPWKDLKVDYVIESTGLFTDRAGAEKHLKAGAKKSRHLRTRKRQGHPHICNGSQQREIQRGNRSYRLQRILHYKLSRSDHQSRS